MNNNELLAPSLSNNPQQPIYSVGAMIAAAFLGGGMAVVFLAGLIGRQQQRLARELPWLLAGTLVTAIALYLVIDHTSAETSKDVARNFRLTSRAIGFAFVGITWLRYRRQYTAMTTLGIESPSPYLAVISSIIVGGALTYGLFASINAWLLPGAGS